MGTDGGVFRYQWSSTAIAANLNNGYSVTQFYCGGYGPTGMVGISGAQDNGTQVVEKPLVSQRFFGGDGAEKCVYKAFDVSGQNVRMKLSCGMDSMGSVDMELAGVMGETEFNYDSTVNVRLPMVGKVAMQGNARGKYIGACPAS